MHVVTNVLALIALGQLLTGDTHLLAARIYLAVTAPTAAAVALWTIARSQHAGRAEKEFAAWYRVPPGCEMHSADGWWIIESKKDAPTGTFGRDREASG
jgi:hypothetical protein